MKKLLLGLVGFLAAHTAMAQCTPSFTATTGAAQNPLTVTFTNTTSFTQTPTVYANYLLKYGDGGQTYIGYAPTNHTYAAPGTYTAKLIMTVHDSITQTILCSDSTTQTFTINYTPCYSTFSASVNQSTSQVTLTASTPGAGSSTPSYSWNFGDGNTGSGSPVTHTYASSGTYTIVLVTSNGGCIHQTSQNVTINNGQVNCAGHTAAFTTSVSSNVVTVNNTSPTFLGQLKTSQWNFGDGGTGTANYLQHSYASAGTYTITLVCNWTDSSNNVQCTSTITHNVTVQGAPNIISGYVVKDSLNMPSTFDSFKVWLITYDANTSMLTAVDSQVVANYNWAYYSFQGKPAGTYLTKAALLNGPSSGTGLVPTYHTSSPYWSQATNINHNGGSTVNQNIMMQTGTITSGPGFIGGNVNQGANKGTGTTGAAVPNLQVILRDANGQPVQFTHTNASGDYSFSNLPLGTYSIYPEEMNYITTPFTNVTLTSALPSATGYIFGVTGNEIKPKATGIAAVSADKFSVYPNPSNGIVYIRWADVTNNADVAVSDIAGHTVYTKSISVKADHANLDLSSLQSGIYFIKVQTERGLSTQKLFLQR